MIEYNFIEDLLTLLLRTLQALQFQLRTLDSPFSPILFSIKFLFVLTALSILTLYIMQSYPSGGIWAKVINVIGLRRSISHTMPLHILSYHIKIHLDRQIKITIYYRKFGYTETVATIGFSHYEFFSYFITLCFFLMAIFTLRLPYSPYKLYV